MTDVLSGAVSTAEQMLDQIVRLLQKVEQKLDEFRARINSLLAQIPSALEWIADRVRSLWNQLMAKVDEFFAGLQEMIRQLGDPGALNKAADSWRVIGGRVFRINDSITDAELAVDDHWDGMAARQYKEALPDQRRDVTSIGNDYAANISTALSSIAVGITAFWGTLASAILAIVTGIATAIALACTGVAAPGAIISLIAGFAGAALSIAIGVTVLQNLVSGARTTLDGTSNGITFWHPIATS